MVTLGAGGWAADAVPVPLERDFLVRAWRPEHGLPDARVLALLPARNGFLRVGTRMGVSRFDGSRFVTWARSTHAELTSEECRTLAEDRDGTVWVGTWGGGVVRLVEPPVRFEPAGLRQHYAALNSAALNQTWSPAVTERGELLVGTTMGLVTSAPDGD